ncbi:MAG: hypothetical protein ACIAXF_08305 [Phycisphaerales bacterium JB063]
MSDPQRNAVSVVMRVLWVVVLLCLLPTAALAQEGDGPLRLSEVNRMIRADQTPAQVVEAAAARGIDFELSRQTLRRLDQWGFSEAQIEQLQRIAAGEAPGEADMPADAGGEAADGDQDAEFPVGYRDNAGTHEGEKRRIERAIADAALGYERLELGRVTLYCSPQRARELGELLVLTERAVIERFPDSITNAIDPRSAHIVVVDGDSEWARWLAAFQASYAQDGITFPANPEGDFKARMANSPGYTTGILSAVRGDLMENREALHRSVTYHLGHLMMNRASRPDGFFESAPHDALVTGFGNLVETMAMGSPSVMVYSYTYEDRGLDGPSAWPDMVRERFREGKIDDVTSVWNFSTDTMQPGHYAEAWSMVSLLCEAEDKFAQAVLQVQRDEGAMAEAVRGAYEIEDARLLAGWRQWAGR